MKDKNKTKAQLLVDLEATRQRVSELEHCETKWLQTEKMLTEANNIINRSPAVVFLWKNDEGWAVEFVSENVEELFGYSVQEFLERKISYSQIIHGDDLERVADEVASYSKKEGLQSFEHEPYRIITKNGDIRWIADVTCIRRDSQGIITHYEGVVYDITERVQAEEALKESEEQFRLVFENANVGMCLVDFDGCLKRVNSQMCEMFGYSQEELESMTVNDISHPEDLDISPKFIKQAVSGEIEHTQFEKRYFHKQGDIVWSQVSSLLVRDSQGAPIHFISHVQDITKRKQVEDELRESEIRFRLLADHAYDWEYWINPDGNYIYISPSCERITGYSAEDFISKPELLFDMVRHDYVEKVHQHYEGERSEETSGFSMKYPIITRNGEECWLEHNCSPVFDGQGRYAGRRGYNRDVTKRVQMEEVLREAELRYRTVADFTYDWEVWEKPDKSLNYISPACERISGYSAEEFIATPRLFDDLILDEDKAIWKAHLHEATLQIQARREIQFRIKKKDGSVIWIEHSCLPVMDEEGVFLGYRASNSDITERMQADAMLRKSKAQLLESQMVAKLGNWDLDLVSQKEDWSDGTYRLFDRDAEEFTPSFAEFTRLVHPDDLETMQTNFNDALESDNNPYHVTVRIINDSGREWVMESFGSVRRDKEKNPLSIFGTVQDITVRVRAEEHVQALADYTYDWESWLAPDGSLKWVNPAVEKLTGYSIADCQSMADYPLFIVHKQHRAEFGNRLRQALAEKTSINDFSFRITCKDGGVSWMAVSWQAIYNKEGACLGLRTSVRDITERKQADEELKKLGTAIRQNPTVVVITDSRGNIEYVNPSFAKVTGYSAEEVLGKNPRILQGGGTSREEYVQLWKTITSGKEWRGEFQNKKKNGELLWERTNISAIYNDSGEIANFIALKEDITERKRTDEELKKLGMAMQQSPAMVMITDSRGKIEYINPKFTQVTGYSAEEVLGKNPRIFQGGGTSQGEYAELWKTILSGKVWRGEFHNRKKNGELYWEEANIATIYDDKGKITHFISSNEDITERKEANEAIQRYAHQMETLNTITAALSTSLELDTVLELILDKIGEVLPLDSGTVFLHIEGDLHVVADCGFTPSQKGHVFSAENELFKETLQMGELLILGNAQDDPRFHNWGQSGNVISWMGVALIVRDILIGFLTLDSHQPNAYSPEQANLVRIFATQAAQAIENARQFSVAQRRLEWLTSLHNIDQAIISGFDLSTSLNILLTQLLEQLEVDAAGVLIYQKNLQSLTFSQGQGFRTMVFQHTNLQLGEGYAGKVAVQRRPVFIPDLSQPGTGFLTSPEFKKEEFVAYYALPLIVKDTLIGVLEIFHRSALNPNIEWVDYLQTLAGQAAIAIDNADLFNNLQRSNEELVLAYDATIEGWARALELRDMETEGHSRRVVDMTIALARSMGISDKEMANIYRGALLHDIGKMGIPDAVLQKHGKLTEEEWLIMRQHPVYAYEWLSPIEYLRPALDIPYCHHEKWDGSGYPRGLKGEQIPLAARIFSVVDVWDALRSDRPYRQAWSIERARSHIQEQSGKQFDPQVVALFFEMLE